MKEEDIKKLIDVRKYLIEKYERCNQYKGNKNAIMRELDHAQVVHQAVVMIDKVLSGYVKFD